MSERLNKVAAEPWLAKADDILALAERKKVALSFDQIKGTEGNFTVDGTEWCMWLALAEPDAVA